MKRFGFYFILFLLTACHGQFENHEIRFAIAQSPLNLDPRYATDAASERVNRLIYQSLVDFDLASKPIPSLGSWVAVNQQLYQFSLNKNRANFHNGQVLSAADVKATYDSLANLTDSPHIQEFSNIKSIKVIDNDTLQFNLKKADKNFTQKLIIGILPRNLIEQHHDFVHKPIGNGPLALVSWNDKLVLKRIHDRQIISLIEVKDPTVRVLKLLHGEVDLLQGELPPELVKYLQSKPEVSVKTSEGRNFSYLGLNMKDPILQNVNVRKALAHAIDCNAIIKQVMVSNTRPASAILPPSHYAGNANLKPYDYNPLLSKQLLVHAGVKLPLKLLYKTSTDAQRVRLATIIQSQMQPAGIDLEIKSLDWGTFFEDVKQGHFQLYGLTWVGINTPDIYAKAFGTNNVPPNGFNRGRYVDSTLDQMLIDENWTAATLRIHQQLPYIPLWYEGQFAAFNKNIKYYSPKPDGNWDDLTTITRSAIVE